MEINKIYQGHTLEVLKTFPSDSIDCFITSPPYWSLRDYRLPSQIWDGDENCKHKWGKNNFCFLCGAWRGSLGLEPTFELYLKHLMQIFDEVKRILKPTGTCWVNIGDSYGGSACGKGSHPDNQFGRGLMYNKPNPGLNANVPAKSLCAIPERFKIMMIERGWICRNTIIWYKRNCMPSSANDRFTVDWEPIHFFTKNNKAIYWTNEKTFEIADKQPLGIRGIENKDWEWRDCPNCKKDIIGFSPDGKIAYHRGPVLQKCHRCKGTGKFKYSFWSGHDYWFEQQYELAVDDEETFYKKIKYNPEKRNKPFEKYGNKIYLGLANAKFNPQGRNKRCVWDVTTKGFPEAHFATFPEDLVEPMIRAGCPEFICRKCGKAREKIWETEFKGDSNKRGTWFQKGRGQNSLPPDAGITKREFKGYSDCGCNVDWGGGIVCDPFGGRGTIIKVAKKLKRNWIYIDLNPEYAEMARKYSKHVQMELI